MKRYRIIIGFLLLVLSFMCIDTFASTRVNIRTEQNYLVPDDVIITESNKWNIMNTPAIDASEKVYDFGNLLTDKEEEKLYREIKNVIDSSSLDFAIVTISENVKKSARDYAHDFYDYNMFNKDGLLFLIDMDTREIYMSTKGSAVSLFPDSRMAPILENVYGKVASKNYYSACSTFVTSIGQFIGIGEADINEDIVVNDDGTVSKNLHLLEIFIFSLIGTGIIIFIMISMNKMVNVATSSREFLNKETMKIENVSETFLGSHVSKTPRSTSSSGGSRGGTSISRGSSGHNHGGMGRKF